MKTAVEWLEDFMNNGKQKSEGIISLAFATAKEMEKQQIIDAADWNVNEWQLHDGELYYNQTFKSE